MTNLQSRKSFLFDRESEISELILIKRTIKFDNVRIRVLQKSFKYLQYGGQNYMEL